jgi:Protein of unknown function (DUF1360)
MGAGPVGSRSQVTVLSDFKGRLAHAVRVQEARYAGGEDRPLRGYAATMTVYGSMVTGLAAAARLTGRRVPDHMPARDILLAAVATHKLSRLIARDPVTSPLRAPFTSYQGTIGPAELREDARGQGAQKTIGELVTCPFCAGVWVATGLTAGLIYLPRTTRLAMGALTALAGADLLQYAHAWLEREAS